jgi:N-acetylmuramoyl-L-alanine amidase
MKSAIAGILLAAFPVPSYAETNKQIDCLTRVIDHEARGEPVKGQEAVAYVIMNRVHSERFADTICKVVKQKGQFTNLKLNRKIPPEQYAAAKAVASKITMSYSHSIDPTHGALFFMAKTVRASKYYIRTLKLGGHVFFR